MLATIDLDDRRSDAVRADPERWLDDMLADSFPASDPPSSWAGPPSRAADPADETAAVAALVSAVTLLAAAIAVIATKGTFAAPLAVGHAATAAVASTPFSVAAATYALLRR